MFSKTQNSRKLRLRLRLRLRLDLRPLVKLDPDLYVDLCRITCIDNLALYEEDTMYIAV